MIYGFDHHRNATGDGAITEVFPAIAFRYPEFDQLVPAGDQILQGSSVFIQHALRWWLEGGGIASDDLSVDFVRFGQLTSGTGKIADTFWVDHRDRQSDVREGDSQVHFVPAGAFHDNQSWVA